MIMTCTTHVCSLDMWTAGHARDMYDHAWGKTAKDHDTSMNSKQHFMHMVKSNSSKQTNMNWWRLAVCFPCWSMTDVHRVFWKSVTRPHACIRRTDHAYMARPNKHVIQYACCCLWAQAIQTGKSEHKHTKHKLTTARTHTHTHTQSHTSTPQHTTENNKAKAKAKSTTRERKRTANTTEASTTKWHIKAKAKNTITTQRHGNTKLQHHT